METLGLSGPPVSNENIFKRIFWPSSDSVDADMLGQQGFWICLIIAVVDLAPQLFRGEILAGVFFASVYLLGGIGVREHDILAAIGVSLVYLVQVIGVVVMMRRPPGLLDLFIVVLLVTNIRGCWIASKWVKAGDPNLLPARMNATWRDRLVDQMPAKVWPRVRVIFYIIAALTLFLTVWGVIAAVLHGPGAIIDV